jgi:hypothetical protein
MTYKEFIDNILETRGRFSCRDEYHERHHIVPKCMGGTNDEDNLIDLFAREHFEAHRLLALENPDIQGLTYAWWCMCNIKGNDTQIRYVVTADEYEEARIAHSKNMSTLMSGKPKSEMHKQRLRENHANFSGSNHPQYGTHPSEETKKKISEFAKTRVGDKNPNYGKHTLRGHKLSEATKQKISIAKQGHSVSDQTRLAVALQNKRRAKKVLRYDLNLNFIDVWNSAEDAHIELNINKSSINACCRGERKTAGGFIWRYADATNSELEGGNGYDIQSNMSEDEQN